MKKKQQTTQKATRSGQRLRFRKKTGEHYWQVFCNIKGKFHSHPFPLSSTPQQRAAWITDEQRKFGDRPAVDGSLGDKVSRYLADKTTMPSFNQRAVHLSLWEQELGRDRPFDSVTGPEIGRVLKDWLDGGLANDTVRKRRTALRSLFVWVNGKGKANPVNETTAPKPPTAQARGLDYLLIERVLKAWPVRWNGRANLSRIRARIMMYSGIPQCILHQLDPDYISWTDSTIWVPGREKGHGTEPRTLKLLPEALAAFKDLDAAHGFGWFNNNCLNAAVKRAFARVGYTRNVRAYDMRHSYLSHVYRVTGDEATVARLGLHAEGSVHTKRYTKGAHQDVDEAAVEAFHVSLTRKRRGQLKPAAAAAGARRPVDFRREVARKVARNL